jgi:cell division protein FtsI (penicillin-binding protein 3)/stage V sporulation protein D (sporulation-specific penicillin-binding protein)
MVSYPTFDPNAYSGSAVASFLNPVTQSIYEPGSVMKVVTMASALDAGAVTPDTAFEDTGSLKVSGREIKNWDLRAHGHVTMTNVIEQSLNTGAAFAERKLGNDAFTKYMNAFGLGEKTGIELPNEVKGDLKRLTPKSPEVAFATASFGQGVAVTPLAMLQAVATLANKGVRLIPSIDAKQKPQEEGRIVSTKAAEQITAMMVSAVDKAEVGAIKGYGLAGKTGTAQVPDFKNGGYSKDVEHTYIGFGPAKDPQFIILLKIDKPAGAPLAGTTVVPAFRSLAQFLISYYNIPPDRLPQ